jgi:predicted aspartyl protease
VNARRRLPGGALAALLATLLSGSASFPVLARDGEPSAGLVELRRLQTGHLLVESTLGGRPARLLVDTGAEGTVITSRSRRHFAVEEEVLERIRGAGIGGPLDVTVHRSPGLTIAAVPIDLPGLHAAEIGSVLRGLGRIAGDPVHGILGQDALLARSALLDVGSARLSLRAGAGRVDAELPARLAAMGYAPIPLARLDNGFHLLTVHVGDQPMRLLLDSGARLSVFHAARAADLEEASDIESARGSLGGAGGGGTAALARLPLRNWRLDSVSLEAVTVGVIDLSAVLATVRERGGADVDGVLGLDVLRPHRAIVDFGADVLYLAPAEPAAIAGRDRPGSRGRARGGNWLEAFLGHAPSSRAPLGPFVSTPLL